MIILFLFFTDSLPPLPDLSKVIFPEPPLHIAQRENHIGMNVHGGEYYGGVGLIDVDNLNLGLTYQNMIDWDTLIYGCVSGSYIFPLPSVSIKPSFSGFLYQRDDDIKRFTPGLDITSSLPWAILSVTGDADLWRINESHLLEQVTNLDLIFDRTPYIPHVQFISIFAGQRLNAEAYGKLHIRNVHLSAGSPVLRDFPSPRMTIQYLDPSLTLETIVQSGVVYKTLKKHFRIDTPVRYSISLPEEHLRVGIKFRIAMDLYHHTIGLQGVYYNWDNRLITNEEYGMGSIKDVQEVLISFGATNSIGSQTYNINNSLHLQYSWTDTDIAFLPRYTLSDTIGIKLKSLEVNTSMTFLSSRDGILHRLPVAFIINPSIGLRFSAVKVYVSVHNASNYHVEVYDGYYLSDRQFAGGIAINHTF